MSDRIDTAAMLRARVATLEAALREIANDSDRGEPMSDDLREQIAQALIRERQRRLAGVSMDAALADADVVLAVVRPVIEQAERERDEASTAYIEQYDLAERLASSLVAAEARVVILGAGLDRVAHHPITQSSDAVTLRQIARDALDAALGDQDTTVTTTYGTENPVRKPKHLTHLGEQDTPEPERCPTCGSDDPTVRLVVCMSAVEMEAEGLAADPHAPHLWDCRTRTGRYPQGLQGRGGRSDRHRNPDESRARLSQGGTRLSPWAATR